ncbi:hypothetical protein AXF42_Ash009164 [Apostasia shenzhenica]|uniref:Uncharacterized protein n=1 Tax=Apostasia shenzhenica TaxID=1088818 RepID=A0A2I0ADN6_9ASPA|nr:hypothetical protein AXF42_Ash009164 [Apostasia shenzhenica]
MLGILRLQSVQMECAEGDAGICNGKKPSSVAPCKEGTEKGEEDGGETNTLLASAMKKGGMKGRRQRSKRKKVQWNDRNGNKLAEVMEFQPRYK